MPKLQLVEDDKALCQNISRWLTGEGYQVTTAHTGEDANEYLNASQFDLLILDWELPGKSGLEVCKRFREKDLETPVLFLTGRSSIEDKGQGG